MNLIENLRTAVFTPKSQREFNINRFDKLAQIRSIFSPPDILAGFCHENGHSFEATRHPIDAKGYSFDAKVYPNHAIGYSMIETGYSFEGIVYPMNATVLSNYEKVHPDCAIEHSFDETGYSIALKE